MHCFIALPLRHSITADLVRQSHLTKADTIRLQITTQLIEYVGRQRSGARKDPGEVHIEDAVVVCAGVHH